MGSSGTQVRVIYRLVAERMLKISAVHVVGRMRMGDHRTGQGLSGGGRDFVDVMGWGLEAHVN